MVYHVIIRWCTKLMLELIRALASVKCVASVHAGYFLAIEKWGDISALATPPW